MIWLRDRLGLTVSFGLALLLCAYGAYELSRFADVQLLDNRPVLWMTLCWVLAQLLLIGTSIVSFRAAQRQHQAEQQLQQVAQLQRSILDSAGPMMIAVALDGRILVFNPAAERMLGYRAEEVLGKVRAAELFPQGELAKVGERLAGSISRLAATVPPEGTNPLLANYVQYVTSFPVSRVRGFEIQCQRKDGSTFPAMVYLSGVRNPEGGIGGLLAICTDLSATKRAEHALRESEERYRDLFENSDSMIATLSPRGRYLYVNPAWQSHFGLSAEGFEGLMSFESAFAPETQAEAAALFRRALNGEPIDQAPLKLRNGDGTLTEVEASLSCRREENRPVSVRCIFIDVTQQNRRERRLGMQLTVSQIVGESTAPEEALPRVMEALGTSLGWDLANFWVVDEEQQVLRFHSYWSAPGHSSEEFRRDSIGRAYAKGEGLPGLIWARGGPQWVEDVREDPTFIRRYSARLDELVTGWGVPVRVGNQVIAAVEFFGRQRMSEDGEIMATVETVCASLGQFIARSTQESRVRELNRQKEFILNSVADGIFGTDPEGRVVFVNPAAAEMLSAPSAELVGQLVHDIVHTLRPDREICPEQCRTLRAFLSYEGTSGQDVFYRSDGSSFPVEFSVTPMVEHGVAMGSVLSFRDISQRYALDRMKDEFISTVSHELRTPLTSIRGALGLLAAGLMGEVSEKAANLMRIAVSNSDRLVRLINDILDLERMQSGRAPLSFRQCEMHELARQAVDALNPVADTARVRIVLEPGEAEVEADSDRMLQVITNLLSNAIKFSPPDSTVRIGLEHNHDGVTLYVTDEGRGIPEDKLESIFDRFQQVDASDSRQKGGTGLGLAICRTIATQHGGRIWAERNPGPGSSFLVFLPVRAKALPPADGNGFLPHTDARLGSLLICSAEAKTRFAIAESLLEQGLAIAEAENAQQTLALARELPLQAVLLDLCLPEGAGWQTLGALREDPVTASLPVLALGMRHSSELSEPITPDGCADRPLETPLLAGLAVALHTDGASQHALVIEDDAEITYVLDASLREAGIHVHQAATLPAVIHACEAHPPALIILDVALRTEDPRILLRWLRQHRLTRTLPIIAFSRLEIPEADRAHWTRGAIALLEKGRLQTQDIESLVMMALQRTPETQEIHSNQALPGLS